MIYSKLLGAGVILAAAAMPTVANAADAYAPVSDTWTGPYVGAFGGYVSLDTDGEYEGDPIIDGGPVQGFLFGGQIGYNKQIETAVLGIEADIAYSDADGDVETDEGETALTDLNYLATVRARAGMVFGESDSTLLFVTGGLAIGEFDSDFEGEESGGTHTGYVIGAGLEHMVTDRFSIKAEYNYMGFGKKDYSDDNEGENISYDGHVAKLGVNFHF
ncbi:MAG: outer membrane protein [Aestuariivirga sp.]